MGRVIVDVAGIHLLSLKRGDDSRPPSRVLQEPEACDLRHGHAVALEVAPDSVARAASNRATGTRKGEHDT